MRDAYDVTLPSQPRVRERVRWLAAEQLERVDGPHKSTTIFNRRTREITLLTSANRTFRQLDMPRQPQEPAPEAILKRGNVSVVAGLHCVDWSWTEDVETRTVSSTSWRHASITQLVGVPVTEQVGRRGKKERDHCAGCRHQEGIRLP